MRKSRVPRNGFAEQLTNLLYTAFYDSPDAYRHFLDLAAEVQIRCYKDIVALGEINRLTFIQSRPKMPLVLALYNFVGRWTTQWELLTTAAFLAIIPVLVLFYVIERHLVAGLAGGAVKE